MGKNNLIQDKSFDFAVSVVKLLKETNNLNCQFVISNQLSKSATSIGANVEEAIGAQSKKDFISKLSIAYKEARETRYWLRVIIATDSNLKKHSEVLLEKNNEVLRILTAILKTSKKE